MTVHVLDHPSSALDLSTLSVTTKGSWLPWGKVAKPLVRPLMPVPQIRAVTEYSASEVTTVWRYRNSIIIIIIIITINKRTCEKITSPATQCTSSLSQVAVV